MARRKKVFSQVGFGSVLSSSKILVREKGGVHVLGVLDGHNEFKSIVGMSKPTLKALNNKITSYLDGDLPKGWASPEVVQRKGEMLPMVKITSSDGKTGSYDRILQWGVGITNEIDPSEYMEFPRLCSPSVLHAYPTLNIALFCNHRLTRYPILKEDITTSEGRYSALGKIYSAEGIVVVKDWLKYGCSILTTKEEIKVPKWFSDSKSRNLVSFLTFLYILKEDTIPFWRTTPLKVYQRSILTRVEAMVDTFLDVLLSLDGIANSTLIKSYVYTLYEINNYVNTYYHPIKTGAKENQNESYVLGKVLNQIYSTFNSMSIFENNPVINFQFKDNRYMETEVYHLLDVMEPQPQDVRGGEPKAYKKFSKLYLKYAKDAYGWDKTDPLTPTSIVMDKYITKAVETFKNK